MPQQTAAEHSNGGSSNSLTEIGQGCPAALNSPSQYKRSMAHYTITQVIAAELCPLCQADVEWWSLGCPLHAPQSQVVPNIRTSDSHSAQEAHQVHAP